MNLIVAVNSDWGIGYNNTQSIVLPEDRKNFLRLTKGCHLIVGRKTFEDLGRPLPGRENIILTHDREFRVTGAVSAHCVDEVLAIIANKETDKVYVIGGGVIYEQFLPMCSRAYITKIDAAPQSDTFFSNLDELPDWTLESQGEKLEYDGIRYSFNVYKNNAMVGG